MPSSGAKESETASCSLGMAIVEGLPPEAAKPRSQRRSGEDEWPGPPREGGHRRSFMLGEPCTKPWRGDRPPGLGPAGDWRTVLNIQPPCPPGAWGLLHSCQDMVSNELDVNNVVNRSLTKGLVSYRT